jgi:iron complex transport system substrate-binding protein
MQRRAFLGGAAALAITPFVGSTLRASAHDATPEASPAATPVLPVVSLDDSGAEVTITDVSRIIPLNGDLAEIVWALGLGDNVVAVDLSATYPEEAKSKPSIGYQLQLNSEAILSYEPTVVLGNIGLVQPVEVIDQIKATGVPVVLFNPSTTIDDPGNRLRLVSQALGVPQVGESKAAEVDAEIAQAEALVANVTEKPRVLFVLVRPEQGIQMVAGTETSLDAIIPAAGAINAGAEADIEGYQPLTPESLITASPDIIILQEGGYEAVGGAEGLLKIPGIAETPAGQNKAFFAYDDQLLLGLGPRTGDLLMQLIADFHPELGVATPAA